MQETLTGELSITRRVRLHARIAETLERLYGEEAQENAPELAYHFGEAEAVLGTEKLVHYSIVAGSRAFDSAGFEDARHHYGIAYAAIKDGDEDARFATVTSGLGRAICIVPGDKGMQEGWDLIARASGIYLELGDSSSAIELAQFPAMFGRLTGTATVVASALEIADPLSIEAGRLNARYSIALVDNNADLDGARAALDRADTVAEEHGDLTLKARVLVHATQAEMAAYDMRKAVELGEPLIAAAEAADDDYCRVRLGQWLAMAYLAVGDREKAEQTVEIALETSLKIKHPIHIRGNQNVRSAFHASRGAFGQATDGLPEHDRRGRESLVEWLIEAETGDGKALMAGAVDLPDPVGWDRWQVRISYAESISAVGRNTSNQELLNLARAFLQGEGPDRPALPRETAQRAIAMGFLAEAEEDRETAGRIYEELSGYTGTASLYTFMPFDRLLGLLASLLDRHADAVQHFESAMELCRRAEFRPQLAWTCSDYAEMLLDRDDPGDREKAIELQDEALAITQELGMRPLTERILARREILRA